VARKSSYDNKDAQPFHVAVSERIIDGLKNGTAPFIKPWKAGLGTLPINPTSGKRYRGINMLMLKSKDHEDPRWLTYKQAESKGWQVRRGESATRIKYCMMYEEKKLKDEAGNPLLNQKGEERKAYVMLDRPKTFYSFVFHASQIDGIPEYAPPEPKWDRHETAEGLIQASGANIQHSQPDRAAYSVNIDTILMPPRGQFENPDRYYAVLLHELGHWTGHSSRLNRDLDNPFGSEQYAREELRVEIASMIICEELGIPHQPQQHLAYINSWIKILEKDSRELVRAARDAEMISNYIQGQKLSLIKDLELDHELSWGQGENMLNPDSGLASTRERIVVPVMNASDRTESDRIYLSVPYREKEQAKAAALKGGFTISWDKEKKLWHAPGSADTTALARWMPIGISTVEVSNSSPEEDFGAVLKAAGMLLDGLPIMDGKMHRVTVQSGRHGSKDGAYQGHLDARPAGFWQNHKTGEKGTWVYRGAEISAVDRTQMEVLVRERKKLRDEQDVNRQARVARRCSQLFDAAEPADSTHPYLMRKQVENLGGIKQDNKGRLIIPLHDAAGVIWSVQRISPDGTKRFQKGGLKSGMFCELVGTTRAPGGAVLIAEGYSTAASLVKATGYSVIVAFDAYNLTSVATTIRASNPLVPIAIMGDRDRPSSRGLPPVGQAEASRAAEAVGGLVVLPTFMKNDTLFTDWNDLCIEEGAQVVYNLVRSGIEVALEKVAHTQKLGRSLLVEPEHQARVNIV
jgi:putative DNA primase/helicase